MCKIIAIANQKGGVASDGIYELRKRQRCENSCRIRY